MGSPKALLQFGATTALGRVVAACQAAGLGPARVVVGAHVEAIAPAARALGARPLTNPRWRDGRTTSIQAGLAALPPSCAAVLLWPVDVCLPGVAAVELLLAARRRAPEAAAWIPCHGGRRGHPVLLTRAAADGFAALGPDEPARTVIRRLAAAGQVVHVDAPNDSVLLDMNTPDDYQALLVRVEGATLDGPAEGEP